MAVWEFTAIMFQQCFRQLYQRWQTCMWICVSVCEYLVICDKTTFHELNYSTTYIDIILKQEFHTTRQCHTHIYSIHIPLISIVRSDKLTCICNTGSWTALARCPVRNILTIPGSPLSHRQIFSWFRDRSWHFHSILLCKSFSNRYFNVRH
jgi:hypothetical protein